MNKHACISSLSLILMLFTIGCAPTALAAQQTKDLSVSLLYPGETTEIEMGNPLKSIIKVTDPTGSVVKDAQVTLSLSDPNGQSITSMHATFGSGDVFRADSWLIPHREQEGDWTITVNAEAGTHFGSLTQTFRVKNSLSELLLGKYGFWVDLPTLNDVVPSLFQEQGDAHNGVVTIGGARNVSHTVVENWLEVEWREGNFNLNTEHDVQSFVADILGNPGFYPLRSLGSFKRTTFKTWDAWLVKARSLLSSQDEQWMIFYAPEVNRTYAIGTLVSLPPVGIDAHSVLRNGFEVYPEVQADGVAPSSLEQLLPSVELISPKIGTSFIGADLPVTLMWKPAKELAEDEYYLLSVDYNYVETNTEIDYATHETQFILPVSLYNIPNCRVFNWQVTLMKQTGTDANGQPIGIPLSYRSLYWFIRWSFPTEAETPFKLLCPNEQY